jgi:hypothetical protein
MNEPEDQPVTVKNWLLTLVILSIPPLNLIMLIVWAASTGTPRSKRTYAQAVLILFGILALLLAITGVVFTVQRQFAG